MHDQQLPRTMTPAGLTYSLQYQAQAQSALASVLRLSRLCAAAPRDDVPPAVAAGLDALREALATYDFWTPPGLGR